MATESLTTRNSRRTLLAAAVGGLAAATAQTIARPLPALAGHGVDDGAESLHMGEDNTTGAETSLSASLPEETPGDPVGLRVHINKGRGLNGSSSVGVGVWGVSLDGDQDHPHVGVEGVAQNNGTGVRGQSKGPFGTPGGSGAGVVGESSLGPGVEGFSEQGPGGSFGSDSGPGVAGGSQSGDGVAGHSETGIGGRFSTSEGPNACYIGGGATSFALGVDNSNTGEEAGGILATSRGGKPTIEGDAFPSEFNPGVGVQGVAYLGTSYDDGQYGEGPGTGVEGISGDGAGVVGRSQRGSGVIGFAGGGADTPPPYGVPGLGHLGAAGFAPVGADPFGIGALGTGQIGVHGFGGLFGIDGRADNAIAGNFVNYAGSVAGAGLRAISPGDQPAVIAWSGSWPNDSEGISPPGEIVSDGGIALEVLGKARFSTAGAGVVPQGSSSVFVANIAVTANSHITATLTGDPGNRHVRWIGRTPGSGFTLNLSLAPPSGRPETPFTYLIVEPVV